MYVCMYIRMNVNGIVFFFAVPGVVPGWVLVDDRGKLSTSLNSVSAGSKKCLLRFPHALLFNMSAEFYLRYYVGHKGKFGHEFLEFEFRPDGKHFYSTMQHFKWSSR